MRETAIQIAHLVRISSMTRSETIAAERHGLVLKRLRDEGIVRVHELSRELAVSPATIRRDLVELERRGLALRVFGGAGPADYLAYAPRSRIRATEKRRIGERAASLVSADETVALAPGTTVVAVAEALRKVGPLTVATNSIPAVLMLESARDVTLILTGGAYNPVTRSLFGPAVEDFYAAHKVDSLFIGAGSLGLDGVSDSNIAGVGDKRAAINAAARTIVVADSSKFERNALVLVAAWTSVTTLVTDTGAPTTILDAIREQRVEVIVAEAAQ